MSKSIEYIVFLTGEDKVRILFQKHRGRISYFIVQYSALIGGRWRSILRYDTCHGYAHKHRYHLHDTQLVINLSQRGEPLNEIFTEATSDIKQNFSKIKASFLRT